MRQQQQRLADWRKWKGNERTCKEMNGKGMKLTEMEENERNWKEMKGKERKW